LHDTSPVEAAKRPCGENSRLSRITHTLQRKNNLKQFIK